MGRGYRDNVCAVLREPCGRRVLLCHRVGFAPHEGWQFPQGGIDRFRDLIEELKRELREEIGTDAIAVLRIAPDTYTYDFPPASSGSHPGYRGQRQWWVLAELAAEAESIRFDHHPAEFDRFEWVLPEEALERIVDFKRPVYEKALRDLDLLPSRG